jgi:uncharacterized membrane protein
MNTKGHKTQVFSGLLCCEKDSKSNQNRPINDYNLFIFKNQLFMKTIGFILIGLGIVMMIFTGFNFVTNKKVVDLGAIEISKEEKTPINWSPIAGGVLLLGGIVVLLIDREN